MPNINRKKYIENFIKIKDKSKNIVDFKFNTPQKILYESIRKQAQAGRPIRQIILKSRQMGISTEIEALLFADTILEENVDTGIITHVSEATTNLYNMSKLMYDCLPEGFRPTKDKDNANELYFNNDKKTGLNSRIKCMTAGSHGVGRSSTYKNLHISELAFWAGNKEEQLTGLLQTVPNLPDTMVFIESTANGFEYFKDFWDNAVAGKNDFVPVFIGWHQMEEYQMPYDGFTLTDEEKELRIIYDLSLEQLTWRRWCIKNNCNGNVDTFKQEYPITPEEAFLGTGKCIFDKTKIINRIEELKDKEPIKIGNFIYDLKDNKILNISWEDDPKGYIKIYQEPKKGYPYVLGGDTAGSGSDSFEGYMIDNTNCNQVAELEMLTDEDIYSQQMCCLAWYYNEALLSIENNYSTHPTKKAYEYGYKKQYLRETDKGSYIKYSDSIGFLTTKANRPVLLALVVEMVRDDINKINSVSLLKQMLTFVKKENGKKEAEQGYHDDRVMAYGIALMSRDQQKYLPENNQTEKKITWPDPLKTDDDEEYDDGNVYLRW